jgi:hypothetical protein
MPRGCDRWSLRTHPYAVLWPASQHSCPSWGSPVNCEVHASTTLGSPTAFMASPGKRRSRRQHRPAPDLIAEGCGPTIFGVDARRSRPVRLGPYRRGERWLAWQPSVMAVSVRHGSRAMRVPGVQRGGDLNPSLCFGMGENMVTTQRNTSRAVRFSDARPDNG